MSAVGFVSGVTCHRVFFLTLWVCRLCVSEYTGVAMGTINTRQLALALLLSIGICALQALAASSGSDVVLPGTPDPASERMLEWVRAAGGQVNVAIRAVPGLGRGVYAPRPFAKGDVFTRLPIEMLWAQHDKEKPEELAGLDLLTEMLNKDSPWRPYFDSLPAYSDIQTALKAPESYHPVIQHSWTEWHLKAARARVQELWGEFAAAHPDLVKGRDMSADNLMHAITLLRTRVFGFPTANVLIPVIDMGNHDNMCRHSHIVESCDPQQGEWQWRERQYPNVSALIGSGQFGSRGGPSGQCMVWRAEEDVATGQAVCNGYGAGLQDRTLLQYGFLQEGPPTEMLSMLDRHTQDRAQWYVPFNGNLSATWAEIDRLASILAHLKNETLAAAAAAVQPDEAADPGGSYLSMLKEWRRQRIAAIEREMGRLYREAHLLAAGFEVWMGQHVENGTAVMTEVKGHTAGGACDCSGAQGAPSAKAAAAAPGIFSRVLRAVTPWNDEM